MIAAGVMIVIGAALMIFGMIMMGGWVSGRSRWFRSDVEDSSGSYDRWLLYTTFVAMAIAPLLMGAILIVYGLHLLR